MSVVVKEATWPCVGGVVPESGVRPFSYFDIEISPMKVNIFERSGDGKTDALVLLLRKYGLRLEERVNSPCG